MGNSTKHRSWRRAATLCLAGLAACLLAAGASANSRLLIAGDSTAADYGPSRYPQMGWGMMLKCGLSPDVDVINLARGGRSTRTFLAEGLWDGLVHQLRPGDTVLIQFGHNDANRAKPERYAPADTVYRDNLLRFIHDARRAGATPVLLTPVARRSFENGRAKADFADYSAVVRAVAAETGAKLIDLEALSRAWLDRKGAEASKAYYLHYTADDGIAAYPEGIADDTHFSELGARGIAELVADALKDLDLPISEEVLDGRPDLKRFTPLGRSDCR